MSKKQKIMLIAALEEKKRRFDVDGVKGTEVAFSGTLINGTDTLKWNYENEDITGITTIKGKQGLLTMPVDAV